MNVLKYRLIYLLLIFYSTHIYAYEFWSLGAWMESQKTPDFAQIKDVKERKKVFFKYLLPEIKKQNSRIIKLRSDIKYDRLSEKELNNLLKYYRKNNKEDLLNSIDIIPASMILAQAAYESSWGRSRFAKHYHNFFGLWCFKKGCGVVPLKRDKEATHEIAKFSSLEKSIEYYMRSINRNSAYKTLRDIRKHKRESNLPITGLGLAEGLTEYAEIGYEYVETVKEIITYNNLTKYDNYGIGI